jgi:hypothetical protein
MTYTALSVIGRDISVVMDKTVSQWRLKCCRMDIGKQTREQMLLCSNALFVVVAALGGIDAQ